MTTERIVSKARGASAILVAGAVVVSLGASGSPGSGGTGGPLGSMDGALVPSEAMRAVDAVQGVASVALTVPQDTVSFAEDILPISGNVAPSVTAPRTKTARCAPRSA